MSGEGHVTTGQVRSCQVLLRSVRTGQVKSGQSGAGQGRVRSSTFCSGQIILGQFRS